VAGGIPILALDMYEHAYHIDFGANVKAYVDTFLRNVDWKGVGERHEDATKAVPPRPLLQPEFGDIQGVGVEEVQAMLAEGKPLQLIDTRPKHFVSRQQDIADGVTWRDPERIGEWMGELSKEKPVVVYCAYGFHVGCRTAIALRDAGFDARYMNVGHSGWKAVGGAVKMHS
jgi:Fe-Mn family superoxide dismutase